MRKNITIVTEPASEPITTASAKLFMRVDHSDEDTLIDELIAASRAYVENYLRRKLITQTLKFTMDRVPEAVNRAYDDYNGVLDISIDEVYGKPSAITLPYPPIQSVTSFVTYNDDNDATTFNSSNYTVDTAGGRVVLNDGSAWPTDIRDAAAIEITYVAGYGDASTDIPSPIIVAMKQHVKMMYDSRDICDLPESSMKLLNSYRLYGELR